jgi:hypothetical protein
MELQNQVKYFLKKINNIVNIINCYTSNFSDISASQKCKICSATKFLLNHLEGNEGNSPLQHQINNSNIIENPAYNKVQLQWGDKPSWRVPPATMENIETSPNHSVPGRMKTPLDWHYEN